jgi:hypothetical protein
LPELRKGEAEGFIQVLILVSTLMLILPFLSSTMPIIASILPVFWVVSLASDLYTTHRFYKQKPEQFKRLERNIPFSFLVDKLGFPRAVVAFTLLVEVPFIMFLASIPIPQVYTFIIGLNAEPQVYFSSALGITGFTHLQAALRN